MASTPKLLSQKLFVAINDSSMHCGIGRLTIHVVSLFSDIAYNVCRASHEATSK